MTDDSLKLFQDALQNDIPMSKLPTRTLAAFFVSVAHAAVETDAETFMSHLSQAIVKAHQKYPKILVDDEKPLLKLLEMLQETVEDLSRRRPS